MTHEDEINGPSGEPSTLVELLSSRAARQPERTAYTYLLDGETEEARITYGELERRARVIGARLQQAGARGSRVLLLYPSGLDYIAAFFGCLYAGSVAVPAYPPRLNRNLARLQAIVADSRASVALTNASGMAKLESLCAKFPELRSLGWEATDALPDELAEGWRDPGVGGDDLAFLQYTSGSTATPKGVMVCHGHILHNERVIRDGFGQSEESVIVGWLPLYHDMGLIGNILQALYLGARCVLMSPTAFLQRPFRWLQAISRYKATTSGGPNFAYDLCARGVRPEQLAALDLSRWSVAFNGAEPIRAATLERFAETFAPRGFRKEAFAPCYGLAEATLMVSSGTFGEWSSAKWFETDALRKNRVREAAPGAGDARPLVGSGRVAAGQRVVIVDAESSRPRAEGEVGEVWVAGPSVAAGYWDKPVETAETFGASLAGGDATTFLRTGDLGFMLGGELFITGRLKDLIIVRGRNHYPQDLELTAERSHPGLRPGGGAAFSVEVGGEEQIVVVQELEPGRRDDADSALDAIFQAVAEEHEVAVHAVVLVKAGRVPRTSSGKIRRGACREQFIKGELEAVAERRADAYASGEAREEDAAESPRTVEELERWFVARLSKMLRVEAAKVDTRRPLARYGLDSLAALELTQAVEARLGVSLPVTTFLQGASVRGLAEELHAELAARPLPVDARAAVTDSHDSSVSIVSEPARHPLSHGQQALWYLQQLSPGSAAYNIAAAVRMLDAPDVSALRRAFQKLLERHASLRSTFEATPAGPVQEVRPHEEFGFQHVDAAGWSEASFDERLVEESRRAFDLGRGPLLRVSLYARAPREHVLLLVVHHIVADFWSLAILARELGALYRMEVEGGGAPPLAPLTSQYADHVRRQAEMLAGPEGERLLDYWRSQLAGELPILDLPTDRPRPPAQTFDGAAETFRLDAELTAALKSLGHAHGATLYTTLLAAFQVLLYRYTNQREVLVGSPASGRTRPESACVVGYFVNPVALRARFEARQSFVDLLGQTRRTVLEALEHQDYPFALLVEHLQPGRGDGRSPIFQVMFVLQKETLFGGAEESALPVGDAGGPKELGGLRVEPYALGQTVAQFDLTLRLTETGEELAAAFEYNTDLFDPPTVRRMADCFQTLLQAIAQDPAADIARLPLLHAAERRLLAGWNDTAVAYDEGQRPLHQLFEAQAARTPEAAALRFGEEELSYAELDARADALARHLRGLGVGSDVPVGVCMERSFEMVVGLLATLKAGGAYMPLDPDSPPERLAFMIEEAAVGALLTQGRWRELLQTTRAPVVCVDEWRPGVESFGVGNVESGVAPGNLAYVIYTSGSTGRPKGVMVAHGAIVNRLLWMQQQYRLGPSDRVLQKTTFSFDVSVWEFFWPLITGACLVLARPGGQHDSDYLVRLIRRERITVLHFVPSMLRVFLEEDGAGECASLRDVVCSGEALPAELRERFYERMKGRLHNLYGPTEAAVDVTFWECERGRAPVPIGRPIANTQIHILNEELEPAPVGVAGELYIAGAGLARGYARRAGLTADRFVPNPFAARGGERMYRTGDLARFMPDGSIEFLGRLDFQVKIRGFRIELGEIESVLKQHSQVRQAVVLARPGGDGAPRLVAYVVASAPAVEEWRQHLARRLPEYMMPSTFVVLDELPLTSSAKVDRRALLASDAGEVPQSLRPYLAPRTGAERLVAEIWSEVLGVERVGVNDNFFELGGHSLLATQFTSRVRERFQVNVPLSALFNRALTVEGMTQAIEEYQIKQAGEQDVDEMLKMLDGLSDEEVRALLADEGNPV